MVVRPYLISQAPEIEEVLKFIKGHDGLPATVSNLLPHRIIDDKLFINPSADLWGFLTLNNHGIAQLFVNNFKSIEGLNFGKELCNMFRTETR